MLSIHRIKKIGKYIIDSDYRFLINAGRGKSDKMPDEEYLKRKFIAIMGTKLDLQNPQTFNEKLQWLKLHDRNPEYTTMVDKYLVRQYITDKIGSAYLIPLLGAWDNPEQIDFHTLPQEFVLKCNHNSGLGMYICRDKSSLYALQEKKIKDNLKKGLKQNYYLQSREWPYKNVQRKIIAEKYMRNDGAELIDYKVHNFNGVPKFILVCKNRFTTTGLTEDFYTTDWKKMDVRRPMHPNSADGVERPAELEKLLELAVILSKGYRFLRTDFYIIQHRVYFSELTFYPASGLEKFVPEAWDKTFGHWLDLSPEKKPDSTRTGIEAEANHLNHDLV